MEGEQKEKDAKMIYKREECTWEECATYD